MKKLLFIMLLVFSYGAVAQIVCPKPEDLTSKNLMFYDWSEVNRQLAEEDNDSPLFVAGKLFEANNQVWQLVMGLFDDNRPRHQAKQLIKKAMPAAIEYDDEDGSETCVYLDHRDKKVPQFIGVTPVPEMKPCPSLQTMKDTPFSLVIEVCDKGQSGCGDYYTFAELQDRGTNWILFSMLYKNEATAIAQTEALKQKAYEPATDAFCVYFQGITKEGDRSIIAMKNPENESVQEAVKRFKTMRSRIGARIKLNHRPS